MSNASLAEALKQLTVVSDVTRLQARLRPDATAMVFGGRSVTYGGLDKDVSRIANGLIAAGLGAGARVAYLGKNTDYFYELLFAAAKARMVLVGVNWRLAAPEVSYILRDAEARILFVETAFLPVLDEIRAELSDLQQVIMLDGEDSARLDFAAWRAAQSDKDPLLPADPEDILAQMYTSGTTGHPKGVLLSHRCFFALRQSEEETGEWASWRDTDIGLVAMPTFHIGGTMWGFCCLYNGGKTIILPQPDAGAIIRAIRDYGVTKMFVVPAVLLLMLDHPECDPAVFRTLRHVIYGASPIPEDLLRRSLQVLGCQFIQEYGMTEVAGAITYLPAEDHDVNGSPRMKSCGKAFPRVFLKVVDGAGHSLPPGEVGEILIHTPSLMTGYWNRPDATAETIVDGWYRSGDAGYLDADGYLYIRDRVKDMVVSGGENIYPAEVESALYDHPEVKDVAVIGVPDDKWGEAVKGVVVRAPGSTVSEAELIAFAKARIAGYKVPKSIDFVDELPRNPSGKILKREIRKKYWAGQERQVG